jgi:hypothetical protein
VNNERIEAEDKPETISEIQMCPGMTLVKNAKLSINVK